MLKELLIAGPVVAGIAYFSGALDMSGYPRTVDGAPAAVMAELADLDIREQAGAPGSTPVGGITPSIRLVKGDGRMDWIVMSGSDVAMTMSASFEPAGDGGQTQITAWVERGAAPDARTSPAFRSEGLTLGLFRAALDAELNEKTAVGWGPECDGIRDELLMKGALASHGAAIEQTQGLSERVVAVGGAAVGLARMHAELVARGCNPDAPNPNAGSDGFVSMHETMGSPADTAGKAATAAWYAAEDPKPSQ